MAFKATRKSPAKKAPNVDEAPKDLPQASVSIEDLVGAPETPPSLPAAPAPVPFRGSFGEGRRDFRDPSFADASAGRRSRGRFDRGHRFGRDLPASRQGFHRGGGYSGGGYRRDEGFSAQGGPASGWDRAPRRDFNEPVSGNGLPRFGGEAGFTPDVDVPTETVRGVLDIMPDGHGFLRPKYTPSERDIYISQSQIRRFLLRNGDMVEGQGRPPKENERYWGLLKVEKVNELAAEQMEKRPRFEDLVPVYPNKQLKLETDDKTLSTKIIDLLAPIGFGQRGLVVSPPKAGKTTILKELASGISANYPDVHLMAVLIGERPEEVTDITRNVKGEVYASNFDEAPDHQTRVAEVALDRAKRLIEMGHDVVILLDSITRLARAYNLVVNPSGRTLTGGFDPAALYPAKKFLGAARCNEPFVTPEEEAKKAAGETAEVKRVTDGGSLTIIGTALVETGSRMDDLIYEEFKGTGNMELHLSRVLQERRIFPAIDIGKSGTRHDELLLGEEMMKQVTTLRHMLALLSDEERTQMLIDRLGKVKDNAEFLESLSQG